MTDAEQREAARQFVNKWKNGGDEKQDCHPFWIDLLQKVLDVKDITSYIQFEKPVKLPEGDGKVHTRYIDGYISDVKVLIEQKGSNHKVSSQRRRYIPMGFMTPDILCSDLVFLVPNATLYHFGVIESNVHMAWTRVVCGRLKSDYRYSNTIVYNNFPWPSPSDAQKALIEKTAQGILDAHALYPDSSLADLYDPLTMPPELRKAHTANDIVVMKAYGFSTKMSEAECVAELMKKYQRLVEKEGK